MTIKEIICKWKFGQRTPDCKGCFSKSECDKVVKEIEEAMDKK